MHFYSVLTCFSCCTHVLTRIFTCFSRCTHVLTRKKRRAVMPRIAWGPPARRRSPCVLACSRSLLHVRVLRCSAVEASDGSNIHGSNISFDSFHCFDSFVCFDSFDSFGCFDCPLRPSTRDVRRCSCHLLIVRVSGWLWSLVRVRSWHSVISELAFRHFRAGIPSLRSWHSVI